MKAARNALYVRNGRLESGLWRVSAFGDDGVADGTIREGGVEPDYEPAWAVLPAPGALAKVQVGRYLLPDPPPLWFVWVDEPKASPAGTNLVAFPGDRYEPGTIVSRYTYATSGVPNGEQAGAVRWYPGGGQVHQIFVAPAWRRRNVASTLLYTADAFHQANGWEGKLHGDGRRTALGQMLLAGLQHPNRAKQLTEEMPPMDGATA
jgi:GNAT superfamily N-acetyltransferase